LVQASEGTFTQELQDLLTSEDHAVALTHVTARRGSHSYDALDAWVFQLHDGQIAEAWWRPWDLYAADELWT
jgi:hypothetical protein